MSSSVHKFLTLSLLTLFIIVAAGCDPQGIPDPTATYIPSLTEPSRAPFGSSHTPTLQPVRTLVPQFTSTPRLITPAPPEGTIIDQSVMSPDGNWTASPSFETLADGYQVTLRVFNSDESVEWRPVDYRGEGLGHSFPSPKQWSADSRFFFYVEQTVTDGGGEFFPVENKWFRLDTESGMVDSIELPGGRGHMFSPDEHTLAYITAQSPVTLVIRDILSGSEKSMELLPGLEQTEKAQAGKILWSPAGDQIILAAATAGVADILTPTFYLMVIQVEKMDLEILYEGKDYIRPLQWEKSGKIHVMDWNSKSWWITAEDGTITTSP